MQEGRATSLFTEPPPGSVDAKLFIPGLSGQDWAALSLSIVAKGKTLLDGMYTQWRDDLDIMVKLVEEWCPLWQSRAQDENLIPGEFIKLLLANKNYTKISPTCMAINDALGKEKQLCSDRAGRIYEPSALKAAIAANLVFPQQLRCKGTGGRTGACVSLSRRVARCFSLNSCAVRVPYNS